MCEYHGTHGHRIEDCRQLREEVAWLLKNGHLREFLSDRGNGHYKGKENHKQIEPVEPQHVINMIIGGTDMPRGPMMKRTKVSIVREKRTRDYVPEGSISFNDEDAEGSSANIIRWRVVEQLGLLDQIVPIARVLSGFNMASETTKGEIFLPVNIAGTLQQIMFYVIEGEMKYNVLLGRPWIHSMREVPSTLHQMLKFPTSEGIKTVCGEQPMAREIFAIEEAPFIQKESVQKAVESTKGKDTK
ncbi:uncharacterized protein LOC132044382 [Lycium ferocissimum]|uniref:uncharacterized protein LOC132044382 n=1 Tax=Lycium ferocissimum TaxID=112874 RepID=UPI00281563B6|nr:uncharacterized protein LOC132044382 [Lycium ferocissimum]